MPHPENLPRPSFDEARVRLRRLTRQIERDAHELRRLTLFLIETDEVSDEGIAAWLKANGFASGLDGQFLPRPSLERFRRGEIPRCPELTYFWPEALQEDPILRAHFHALRHLAGPMASQIEQLHQLPQFIYFQDARNGVITYPFIDSQGIIPPDFDWKTYYPWQAAGPEANPQRTFKWVSPIEDLGAQGPFIIGSMPVYRDDECLGIWSMDIPLSRFQDFIFPVAPPTDHYNFVIDDNGRIVLHTEFGPVVRSKDRLLIWKPLAVLGGEFVQLDPSRLQAEGQGQKHLINGEGRMMNLLFHSLPALNWILIGLSPIPEPITVNIATAHNNPTDPYLFHETLDLCIEQALMLKGWEQSYQTLISRFSAVFYSLSPSPKITALYISPVSYTHLTLPTNREV